MTCFLRLRIPGIRMSEFYSPHFTKVSIFLLVGLGQFQVKLQFKYIFHVQESTCQENSLIMRWSYGTEVFLIGCSGSLSVKFFIIIKWKFAKFFLEQDFVLWAAWCQVMQMLSMPSIIMPKMMTWFLAINRCYWKKTFPSRPYRDAYKEIFSLLHGQLIFKILDKVLLWDLSMPFSAVLHVSI